MLCVALFFKHTGVLANNSKSLCVCVLVCVFTHSPLLSSSELPLITETYCVIKKQTHQNRVFVKLCEMLSGDLVTFVLFGVLWKKKKAERWQKCSTVSLKEIKGRLYHRNTLHRGCLYVIVACTEVIFSTLIVQYTLYIYI